jgi:hypothetical protein
MKRPPMVVSLHFRSYDEGEESAGFRLWVPLFIIAPIVIIILLALFLLALPFLLVAFIFTWYTDWWRYLWHGIPAFINTLHELTGLNVDVEDQKQKIYIAIH